MPFLLVLLLASSPAAQAADSLKMYQVTVGEEGIGVLHKLGVDLGETNYVPSVRRAQTIYVDLIDVQARAARDAGLALAEITPGPHVSEGQIERRLAADDGSSAGARAAAKPETGGDSPNAFYDVYRTYSEPGGVKDEMTQLAFKYRDIAKLVVIGKSGQGQDIVALKVTNNARNVADGARPAMLFSAVNHAREWIAAEVGRRLPTWWLEHADDPQIAELLGRSELWFLPVQNPDGYDYTFTCGQGFRAAANQPCGATLVTDPADPRRGTYVYKDAGGADQPTSNRLWRKTVRDNDGNGIFGDPQDGVDPNRNYPTAWGLDEEGASNNRASAVYRGPNPLSEPEDLAYDRLLRKIVPEAVINYHSAAQLLLYPFGYITDVYADDDPWFRAITGTDGDAAVDPYISQRSSDLYITNGETTDHAYNKYKSMSWTPELDECQTAAGGNFCIGGSGFLFPDDEGKIEAVFQKNLDFARNVAQTVLDRDRPDRPRNATDDQTQYQVKGSPDIEVSRFNVSYGLSQTVEAFTRKILGPVDIVVTTGVGGTTNCDARIRTATVRAEPWRGGERFGDLRGKYYQRVRGTIPDAIPAQQFGSTSCPARPFVVGDTVNVRVISGSQRQRFSYRIVSARPAGTAGKRVLVVAAEDYEGLSPNKTAYAAAPRYLDEHVAALEANGYAVETLDLDNPPAGPSGEAGSEQLSDLGVLSHFDAVLYYTGDDLLPQAVGEGVTDTDYRRGGTPSETGTFGLTGSQHLKREDVRNAQMLRNFMNDGGKVVFEGRNGWVQQTSTPNQNGFVSLTAYSGYRWWQEPAYGFEYSPNQAGDDDRPHTAFFRELNISNDWGQWWLGVAARQGGPGTTTYNAAAVTPGSTGFLTGMPAIALDTSAGAGGSLEPTQNAETGAAEPRAKAPTRLRSISSVTLQRPFRQERVEADYAGETTANGGAIISTRDSVSLGFGLEQITDAAVREELVRRMMAHLLPATADTAAPSATWLRPDEGQTVNAADPVEIEVEAVDERGDMKEVRLLVEGRLVERKVSFPFQMRYQPTAADIGQTKTLVAEAEDKAGNVTTITRTVTIGAASAMEEAPLPTGVTTTMGKPVVGETLTCVPSGFTGNGVQISYEWLRDGAVIGGATGAGYQLGEADLGRDVSCRATARNSAGDADATSDALTVSAAAAGPRGPAGPQGPPPGLGGLPPAVDRADRRVSVSRGPLRVDRNRRVRVGFRCGPTVGTQCRGIVQLLYGGKRVFARVSFRATANRTTSARLRLNPENHRLLVRKRQLKVTAIVLTRGSDGVLRRQARRVTLQAPARR